MTQTIQSKSVKRAAGLLPTGLNPAARFRCLPDADLKPRHRKVWPALLVLAGVLIFCHGCHADKDNELVIGWWKAQPPVQEMESEE